MCIMFQGSIIRLEFELSRLHNGGHIGLRAPKEDTTTSRVR